jgi:hypothetical protein
MTVHPIHAVIASEAKQSRAVEAPPIEIASSPAAPSNDNIGIATLGTASDLYRGAAIYFCICYTLALYGRHLERRALLGH